jgi:cytochrome c556
MKKTIMRYFGVVAVVAALVPIGASALEDPELIEAQIEFRQNVMRAIGGLTGASVGVIRDQLDYRESLAVYAATLHALTRDIPALFPEGTDFGDTDAKPEVWSERAKFEQAAAATHERAGAFLEAVNNGDNAEIGVRFRDLGESCRACHDEFRVKRE